MLICISYEALLFWAATYSSGLIKVCQVQPSLPDSHYYLSSTYSLSSSFCITNDQYWIIIYSDSLIDYWLFPDIPPFTIPVQLDRNSQKECANEYPFAQLILIKWLLRVRSYEVRSQQPKLDLILQGLTQIIVDTSVSSLYVSRKTILPAYYSTRKILEVLWIQKTIPKFLQGSQRHHSQWFGIGLWLGYAPASWSKNSKIRYALATEHVFRPFHSSLLPVLMG